MINQASSAPTGQPSVTGEAQPAAGHYVVFRLDQHHYALPLTQVARAVRMVAVTPVPDEPPWILGVINMAGQVLPVLTTYQFLITGQIR